MCVCVCVNVYMFYIRGRQKERKTESDQGSGSKHQLIIKYERENVNHHHRDAVSKNAVLGNSVEQINPGLLNKNSRGKKEQNGGKTYIKRNLKDIN